jgi:hypothetical protein
MMQPSEVKMRLLSIFLAAIMVVAVFHGYVALADDDTLSAGIEVSETHGPAPSPPPSKTTAPET